MVGSSSNPSYNGFDTFSLFLPLAFLTSSTSSESFLSQNPLSFEGPLTLELKRKLLEDKNLRNSTNECSKTSSKKSGKGNKEGSFVIVLSSHWRLKDELGFGQ